MENDYLQQVQRMLNWRNKIPFRVNYLAYCSVSAQKQIYLK